VAEKIHIVFNNGHFPDINYIYRVVFDDYYADVTDENLATLEYDLEPINSCLVFIRGADFNGVAMCDRDGDRDTVLDPELDLPQET